MSEANSKVAEAYDRWSGQYDEDRNLTRDLDAEVAAALLGGIRCDLIIEAGCGTGKNTERFAACCDRVLAMDFSPGMLARARARIQASNVEFVTADLTQTWPCADGVAGLVSCNLVLEHIRDLEPVFREASRTLIPGGRFLVSELHPFRQYLGRQARFVGEGGETERIPAFTHHVSDFFRAATEAGFGLERFEERWHEEDKGEAPRLIAMLFRKSESAGSPREANHKV